MTPIKQSSIIDNQGDNTLLNALRHMTSDGKEFWMATAFFSLDALNMLGDAIEGCESIRLMFGSDAAPAQRRALLAAMRTRSDADLLKVRESDPLLSGLKKAYALIQSGAFEARVFCRDKFHAKAYLTYADGYQTLRGVLGSGNLTRPGLTQNIELNVHLNPDQAQQLREWYESMWALAEPDNVTADVLAEIRRQIELYSPYAIYMRSLLAWGDHVQGRESMPTSRIVDQLDAHQEDAYRQAIKLLEREGGVMVCDGVGLGKSYVALALMERALLRGERVMLIAPKAILDSSWDRYLRLYLQRYRQAFDSLIAQPMTWFGTRPKEDAPEEEEEQNGAAPSKPTQAQTDFWDELDLYSEQAELVVIDESHNFRKTNANRYVNVLRMLQPKLLGRKKIVLMTATPLNTEYQDVTAQFRLITLDKFRIGGFENPQLQKEAVRLDQPARKEPEAQPSLYEDIPETWQIRQALEAIAIQRSRRTCIMLAEARGKKLRFPTRETPQHIAYDLSPLYQDVVHKAHHDFTELARFIEAYKRAVRDASGQGEKDIKKRSVPLPRAGLRFSAYIPDRYRKRPGESLRGAQVESFLVSLVFTNVIKQLESSPEAFLGILRSLGKGLCGRLRFVFGDEVDATIAPHMAWIQDRLGDEAPLDDPEQEETFVLGEEDQKVLDDATRTRTIRHGLKDFGPETHNVKLWREHIESDLDKLRGIYEHAYAARHEGEDKKLEDVAAVIRAERAKGRKVLIFTQSVRTSYYLHRELRRMLGERVERIDAGVQGERRTRILHEFSPRYNSMAQDPLDLEPLTVLVSTDVLSEGVNLQEAGCILNYDLHWNPVRLIQRIGRVDRRLNDDDPDHSFSIFNVVPPPEIERLIDLVDTVELRKRKISRLLGLDQAFFSADDDAGTLREFNARVDGTVSLRDEALARYTKAVHVTPAQVAMAEAVPPGGFGVWKGAPSASLFALFTLEALPNVPGDRRAEVEPLVGRPVLVLRSLEGGEVLTDAAKLLDLMSRIEPGAPSGDPSAPDLLRDTLKRMRSDAFQTLRLTEVKKWLTVRLECWMEWRP